MVLFSTFNNSRSNFDLSQLLLFSLRFILTTCYGSSGNWISRWWWCRYFRTRSTSTSLSGGLRATLHRSRHGLCCVHRIWTLFHRWDDPNAAIRSRNDGSSRNVHRVAFVHHFLNDFGGFIDLCRSQFCLTSDSPLQFIIAIFASWIGCRAFYLYASWIINNL